MAEVSKKEKGWMKIKDLRSIHQKVFEELGVPNALFFPKMFYTPQGKEELHISFFMNELQRGQDIYTEMVDREFNSEDEHHTLYKWNYNELWATQYQKTSSTPVRYLIPVSELEKVVPHPKDHLAGARYVQTELFECSDEDCPLNEMTMRDLVAIWTKKPVSKKKWLNDILKGGSHE